VPVAKVEGPHSLYPKQNRLTADRLAAMAKAYDPKFRRAPVICGYDPQTKIAGPSHTTGRYLPMRGGAEELRFDGTLLEARITQNADHEGRPAVESLVKGGFPNVSIKFLPKCDKPGYDGWYLEHIALLSGETPGTPGIPSLSEVFRALDDYGIADALPFIAPELPTVTLDGHLEASCYRSLEECERSWIDPNTPNDGPEAVEEAPMTAEEITAAVQRALTDALPGAVKTAVDAAVAPINASLEAVKTESAAAKATAETAETTARALAETAATASIDARLAACTKDGRLPNRDLEMVAMACRSLPEKERGEYLTKIEARKPLSLDRGIQFEPAEEFEGVDVRSITTPDISRVDPDRLALDQKIRAVQAKGGADMTYEQAYQRVLAGGEAN